MSKKENIDAATAAEKVKEFFRNEENRKNALDQATKAAMILNGGRPLDHIEQQVFTTKQLHDRTTMSHKQVGELLTVLKGFGFVEQISKMEFRFNFDHDRKLQLVSMEIAAMLEQMQNDFERYTALVKEPEMTDEQLEAKRLEFKQSIIDKIKEW